MKKNELIDKVESIYKIAFDTAATATALVAGSGHFIDVNQRFSELTGYNKVQLIGQPLTDIFHFRGNAKDLFNKIFDHDGDGADFQVRLIHKNGSLADVTARAEMLNDEVGQRQCYALKVERIDQDRMAHLSSPHLEKALQRERERFLEIFNKAPVTMCILKGPNHVFESANERYLKFF